MRKQEKSTLFIFLKCTYFVHSTMQYNTQNGSLLAFPPAFAAFLSCAAVLVYDHAYERMLRFHVFVYINWTRTLCIFCYFLCYVFSF